jgi:hypothetical protein
MAAKVLGLSSFHLSCLTLFFLFYFLSWQFIPYFAFSATVVLYVHAIQQRNRGPGALGGGGDDDDAACLRSFQAAQLCQRQLATMATANSLSQRYGMVLQELQLEVQRHNSPLAAAAAATKQQEQQDSIPLPHDGGKVQVQGLGAGAGSGVFGEESTDTHKMDLEGGGGGGEGGLLEMLDYSHLMFSGESPDNPISQMTGWGQFDSLVGFCLLLLSLLVEYTNTILIRF